MFYSMNIQPAICSTLQNTFVSVHICTIYIWQIFSPRPDQPYGIPCHVLAPLKRLLSLINGYSHKYTFLTGNLWRVLSIANEAQIIVYVQDTEESPSPPNQGQMVHFARKIVPAEKIWKLNLAENSSISASNYIDDPRDSLRQFICQPISGMMTISIIYKILLFKFLHQYLFSFSSRVQFISNLFFCFLLCPFCQPYMNGYLFVYLCFHFHNGLQSFLSYFCSCETTKEKQISLTIITARC